MHKKTKDLLDRIDKQHDWQKGQTHSSGGTRYTSTDTCRICGLERECFSDKQNGVDEEYTFTNRQGEKPPLVELLDDPCLDLNDQEQ